MTTPCEICGIGLDSNEPRHATILECVRYLVAYVKGNEQWTIDEIQSAKDDMSGDIRDVDRKIDSVESDLRSEMERS